MSSQASAIVTWRRDVVVALGVGAVTVLLGAPVGLLWAHLAPHVPAVLTDSGVYPAEAEPQGFIGADGVFLFLTLGVGVVVAALIGLLDRSPSVLVVVALAGAGCLAAVVAWHVGHRVGLDDFRQFSHSGQFGKQMDAYVRVHAKSIALAWGLGAVLGYGAVASLRTKARPAQWENWYGSSVRRTGDA